MARAVRREPTIRGLDERLTNVERELAQVVSALTISNDTARREIQTFREAFMEHRADVRQSFADVLGHMNKRFDETLDHTNKRFDATHELIAKLHGEIMGQLEKIIKK